MTTRYLWCGDAICQDRDQNDNVLSRDLDEGEYNAGTGQKLVYMPDQLGSVRDVLDGTTGALVAATDFTPYGAVGQTYGTTTTDYRYANLLYHTDSGLNLSATRPQDGVTGRWLGRDPTREAGGVNLYAYVGGNPINGIDPRGLVDLIVSGGFHAPLSPGVAVGKTQTYVLYTNNQHVNTGLEDPTNEAELGTIADAGINFGVRDISGTNGQCAGVTINYGLGKYFGFSITHRLFQDTSLSIFNPYRYIDGVTLNIGFGANIFASPVSISGPI
jgi:RHS repeat-associated protein